MVTVQLLGGKEVIAVDAIDTEGAKEAHNTALNMFLQMGEHATVYGGTAFLPETIGTVMAEVLGRIDLTDENNKRWADEILNSRKQQQKWSEAAAKMMEDEAPQER
jgi:hypothetical protein